MNYFIKSKWLILIVALLLGISFSNCGKKKSGLLLLPDLVEGQGGPKVSPDNAKISQEETSTQEESPTVQIEDDNGAGQTDTTDNSSSSEVIYIEPISNDNNNQNAEDNNTGNTSDNNNSGNTGDNNNNGNNDNNSGDNNGRPIVPEPPVPVDTIDKPIKIQPQPPKEILPMPPEVDEIVNDTDVSKDPIEAVVISDNTSTDESSSSEATEQEESQEDTVATTEEENEEQAEVDEADDNNNVVVKDEEEDQVKGKDKDNKNCKISVKSIDTTQGRWFNTPEQLLPHPKQKNKSIKGKGIHTYWAYEKLLVNVNNNCEGGKYKLTIVAKNYGKLPDWYHFFNVKVVNNKTGENLGNMLIRASDERYHRGELIVNLPKGSNVLNILWTNDVWEPNVYDANIQIKRIKINKVVAKEPKQILSRKGSNFCDTQGRWFVGTNPPSAYTYWQNQTISYCFVTKQAGKYEILVRAGNAKNGLPLMPEYKEFKVLVAANGNSNYITIPAEQGKYNKGTTTLDLPEGNIVLNVTWLNEKYQPPEYDANIEITRVKLKRVGDIESPISAFLLQNPNITYKLIIPGIILILGALGLIYWIRRERIA